MLSDNMLHVELIILCTYAIKFHLANNDVSHCSQLREFFSEDVKDDELLQVSIVTQVMQQLH